MVFRKYAVHYYSQIILVSILLVASAWLYESIPVPLLILIDASLLLTLLINPLNDKIRVNECGICCFSRCGQKWFLRWDEIEVIQIMTVYGHRGYRIVPKQPPVQDLHKVETLPDYKIQHTAKLALTLKEYASHLITK